MKFRVLTAAALFAACASQSPAAEPWSGGDREKAVMLYFSKSFGEHEPRRYPLALGLRLQQSSVVEQRQRVDLFDVSLTGKTRLSLLNGALRLDAFEPNNKEKSSEDKSWDSSSAEPESSEEHRGMVVTFSILGVIGAACAFEVGICRSDDGSESTSETPTPSTPGQG